MSIRMQIARAAEWISEKANPPSVKPDGGSAYVDLYRRQRTPTSKDLINQYRRVAYACATINAYAVAQTPLRLYVQTNRGQARPRCGTRPVVKRVKDELSGRPSLSTRLSKAVEIEEVTEHPLVDLLDRVNPHFNRISLLTITQLYEEILGNAYWLILEDGLGVPESIWPLPAQNVTPKRDKATGLITSYKVGQGPEAKIYEAREIIHCRLPNLSDPYGLGSSPLQAAYEDALINAKLLAHESATLDNQARPDSVWSPEEPIGQKEAERLEKKINRKFRKGGTGGVLVAESGLKVSPLTFKPKDLEAVARRQASRVDIANAFGVPMSLLQTEDVNRANADAGHYQHAKLAVAPRTRLLEGQLTEDLCSRYDERLFLAFDNPIPEDAEQRRADHKAYVGMGVQTINEIRAILGKEPVAWGEEAWLPMNLVPVGDAANADGAAENQ